MITVTVWRTEDHMICRFKASGHAGYAPAGNDIICSAITAITTTAIGSLADIAGLETNHTMRDGLIECRLKQDRPMTDRQRETAAIILESMLLGCRQIEESYGRTYVQVREKQIHQGGTWS
ncbi:MAG: ribosomal-processing cysteine protease Prp [Eubacteriales bacterium]|nr:ribosomal-processing cysteine protease Prp [Eubacteriales bacterium]